VEAIARLLESIPMANSVDVFPQSDSMTLREAVEALGGFDQSDVPWQIWLMEDPDSPIALPGKISLFNHDCLHVLLGRGFSNEDEAFVVAFTMGNDQATAWYHVTIFKLISLYFYPIKYRFSWDQMKSFEQGYRLGELSAIKNLNSRNIWIYANETVAHVRQLLLIDIVALFDQ
jgi:hypothetical protein